MAKKRTPGRHCQEILEDGERCKGWALRSTWEDLPDEQVRPRCRTHSMTPEERVAMARSMAGKSAVVRRGAVEARPRSDLQPGISLAEVLATVAPALQASDPWTGEALWPVRLAAAGTLLSSFPSQYRESPEKVEQLLEQLVPDRVLDRERMKAEAVFEALRAEWDTVKGLRWDKLVGLYVRRYPPYCIAPFEDAREINGRRPKPAPDASVKPLPGGGMYLERDGKPGLIVPVEEPEDGDIEVDVEGTVPAW
jgi:hypothetical protein